MAKISLRAPAKINWTLDVIGKQLDGYHQVEMLMQSIALWDEVVLTEYPGSKLESPEIHIRGNSSKMPLDESNLAVKAASLIMQRFEIFSGLEIEIIKNIPMEAGLAGGSTDAAAVLTGLNSLWKLGLSLSDLNELGTQLGADVPFCITGGTAIARGIGNELYSLPPLKGIWLVLLKPPFGMSTADVYQGLSLKSIKTHPNWNKAYELLQAGQLSELQQNLVNVLESVAAVHHPEIGELKEALIRAGAAASAMTGSGPAVFGVFSSSADAHKAALKFKLLYCLPALKDVIHDKGVEIIEGGDDTFDKNQCSCFSR